MSPRVDQIIKELSMYERAEDVGTLFKLHDTVIHELHIELDRVYNTISKEDAEADINELKSYSSEVTDNQKKELIYEIMAYIEKKV